MPVPLYRTGRTYPNEDIKHTRLDHQTQYPDCSCGGSDTDPVRHQGLAVSPLGACVTSHRGAVNKTMERQCH